MANKIDNFGKLIHATSGIVVGFKNGASENFIPIILAQSAAAASVTGTLTETTLANITVPGGIMGANGSLRITPLFSYTNSANTKTPRIRFGGIEFFNPPMTTTAVDQAIVQIRNKNSQAAQIAYFAGALNGLGNSSGANTTAAVDTSVDQVITITGQLTNVGEVVTLEGYTVEILPGA